MKTHCFDENLVFHGIAFPAGEIEEFLGRVLSQSPFFYHARLCSFGRPAISLACASFLDVRAPKRLKSFSNYEKIIVLENIEIRAEFNAYWALPREDIADSRDEHPFTAGEIAGVFCKLPDPPQ